MQLKNGLDRDKVDRGPLVKGHKIGLHIEGHAEALGTMSRIPANSSRRQVPLPMAASCHPTASSVSGSKPNWHSC